MFRLNVGIVTMLGTPWALEENFQRMEAYVRVAAQRRAELVIAPEAILDGYVAGADPDTTHERMLTVAQSIGDSEYLARASDLCRELGIYLIFGFLERDGDDLFNSCALFDPQGDILARYSKVHPANESHITPGRSLQPVDTPLGRVGFLICSDRTIVDNFSTLGVQGVDVIFLPMDGSGGQDNTQTMRMRARDNGCWIVVANTWSCAIVSPTGAIILENYQTECVSVQRIDLYDVPKGEKRSRFMGRRPDLYGPLTESYEENKKFGLDGRVTPFEEAKRRAWLEELRVLQAG